MLSSPKVERTPNEGRYQQQIVEIFLNLLYSGYAKVPMKVWIASHLDLAIIIVSYNTRDMLRACLHSVYAGLSRTALDGQVWVVDNASSDGSADMVRAEFPQTRLLALDQNLGFAGGNNVALRELGFDTASSPQPPAPNLILFLNPDTEVRGDALAQMADFLLTTDRAGVVGASLVYPDGRFQHSAFHFPTLWQIWLDFFPWPGRFLDSPLNGRYPRALYQAGRPFPIDHPLGAAMMTRAEVIQQVGLMDEGFFMYAEEVDWCMRVKKAGWGIYCVPAAQIVHHAGGSTRQFRDEMFAALWRSRFRLFHKHYGPAFNSIARLLVRLGLWAKTRRAR
jgi:N-acetylglucosaminyl-diphospho-decaprenol L-rhamnosyltransferase